LGSICITEFLGGCLGGKLFSIPSTFAVGASGAIFALVGLLAVITPKNRVYLIGGPLIAIVIQAILIALFPALAAVSVISMLINIYIIHQSFRTKDL